MWLVLGMRGWRRRTEDREEWKPSSEEGQGPEGDVAPYMKLYKYMQFSRALESYFGAACFYI